MTNHKFSIVVVLAVSFALGSAGYLTGIESAKASPQPAIPKPMPSPPVKASYPGYRGVMVGLSADEARKKLGDPKDKSETQDFFVYDENESVQVFYDKDHNVSLVSVSFVDKLQAAPSPKDVFGEAVQPNADGSIYRTARYPKAGYSISYSRTAGENPIITITMQKISQP